MAVQARVSRVVTCVCKVFVFSFGACLMGCVAPISPRDLGHLDGRSLRRRPVVLPHVLRSPKNHRAN